MTNLSTETRAELAERVPFSTLELAHEAHSADGTVKALFHTQDGHPVEAVLMRYRDGRRSVCISSQSGCPLTCTFCATGQMRFRRNLTASEIVDQALHFRRIEAIDHVVFMGMGEPMLNFDAVIAAAQRASRPRRDASPLDDLDRRLAARVDALRRRGRGADPPGALAARTDGRPAERDHAGERSLSPRSDRRRMPPLLRIAAAQGVRRVRDARRGQRLRRARARAWSSCSTATCSR